jgi:hypothetical protein
VVGVGSRIYLNKPNLLSITILSQRGAHDTVHVVRRSHFVPFLYHINPLFASNFGTLISTPTTFVYFAPAFRSLEYSRNAAGRWSWMDV